MDIMEAVPARGRVHQALEFLGDAGVVGEGAVGGVAFGQDGFDGVSHTVLFGGEVGEAKSAEAFKGGTADTSAVNLGEVVFHGSSMDVKPRLLAGKARREMDDVI